MEKQKEINKKYSIKALSMVNHLVRQGFDLIGASDNKIYPQYKVFYFIDTPELRKAMSNFKKD